MCVWGYPKGGVMPRSKEKNDLQTFFKNEHSVFVGEFPEFLAHTHMKISTVEEL